MAASVNIPNAAPGATGNFEFEALRWASNYRHALLREFAPYLKGDVIEVGAGIGQFSELISSLRTVQSLTSVEPDAEFCANFKKRLPTLKLVSGTASALAPGTVCDAIVTINVLEHIEQDEEELSRYKTLLSERRGTLCLFVPARPEIYAPLDRDFGHFRRYLRPELRSKLEAAGFEVARLTYFNFVGYFAWWLSFCVFRKRSFNSRFVRLFDQVIFPVGYGCEARLLRPPIGQSLLAVARARPK